MNVFDPHIHIQTVTIVGTGGTGAQIARSAARMIHDLRAARMHAPQLILIDPDTVEARNIGRQHFSASEIGQPKAHVLMRRLNAAFGPEAIAIAAPFSARDHFSHGTVLIGTVDNHLARRELAQADGALWIDSGNHRDSGQVVIGNTGDAAFMRRHLDGKDGKYAYLPNAALLFPDLLEPDTTPAPSCADAIAAREQSLLVNDWVALTAAQMLYKLLYRQPIHHFLTYVSSDGMSVRSVPINREELSVFLEERTS